MNAEDVAEKAVEFIRDIKDDFRATMSETCEKDDMQHCSCVPYLRKQISIQKDETEQLKSKPTAEQERNWVLHYLSNRGCHIKVDGYFEGSRALERAKYAIEHGEHWPKGETP
jgi:hypothetical protein